MSIATDRPPELSCAAPWPRLLQRAGSRRVATQLHGMLRRIQRAYVVGDWRQLRYLIQQYLASFGARFAASRLAARKMSSDRRPKQTQIQTTAENLNAFQGTREEVRLQLIPKDGNLCRPTLDFGIENRALQNLVRSVLLAIAELHPRQFATRGGVPAAIAQVVNAMNRGYCHAREIDIKDCYASFDGNKLVDLIPVPKKVIENVLLSEHLNIIVPSALHHTCPGHGPADTDQKGVALLEKYLANARRGIPQGSAASPILAEMLLAPLLFQVPVGGEVVAYADNILVLAKSDSDADAMTESLGIALKQHPAGPLWPRIKPFPAGGPIYFLGHRLIAHKDKVRVEPSPANRERFECKMNAQLARLRNSSLAPVARDRLVQDLKSDLSSHASNFRHCEGVKEYRQYWLTQIASAKNGGAIMQQSKSSSTKRMVFWPHPDQAEIITAALDLAKEQVSTNYQTVALEAIAQAYMATGIVFKKWEEALTYHAKHSDNHSIFVENVIERLEQLFPELKISANVEVRSSASSACVTSDHITDSCFLEEAEDSRT